MGGRFVWRRAIHTDRKSLSYVLCGKRDPVKGVKVSLDECKGCDCHEGVAKQDSSNPFNHNWEVTCTCEGGDN